MKKTMGCRQGQKISDRAAAERSKNLEAHFAGCAECRESQKVSAWMLKFAAQTAAPQNLPASGLFLFKTRLFEKQSAARRAVQPIAWMRVVAIILSASAIGWLSVKTRTPVVSIFSETFLSLSSVVPLLIFGLLGAVMICSALAYKIRGEERHKR